MQTFLHSSARKMVYSQEQCISLFFAYKCSLEDGGELMEVKIKQCVFTLVFTKKKLFRFMADLANV